MSHPIQDEIHHRIHEKMRQGIIFSTREVSSITLGINVYNDLRDEIDSISMAAFTYSGNYRGPEILGHKVRICYKRKNLIQINIVRKRRPKCINLDYYKNLNLQGDDCQKTNILYDELQSLIKKSITKDYPVFFLTSE